MVSLVLILAFYCTLCERKFFDKFSEKKSLLLTILLSISHYVNMPLNEK